MRGRCAGDASSRENSPCKCMARQKGERVKPGVKKAALGKTMRVATVFTGAAACAAAFAPAAQAATGHQAAPDGKTLTDARTLRVLRAAAMPGFQPNSSRVSGQISWTSHCANTPKYVHLVGASDYCVGHDGIWSFGPSWYPFISRICGGNNSGSYENTSGEVAKFHPGTTYAHLPWKGDTLIRRIRIKKYTGNDECPAP